MMSPSVKRDTESVFSSFSPADELQQPDTATKQNTALTAASFWWWPLTLSTQGWTQPYVFGLFFACNSNFLQMSGSLAGAFQHDSSITAHVPYKDNHTQKCVKN